MFWLFQIIVKLREIILWVAYAYTRIPIVKNCIFYDQCHRQLIDLEVMKFEYLSWLFSLCPWSRQILFYSRTASGGKKQQQIHSIFKIWHLNGWAAEDTNIEFNLWVGYNIRNILILVIPWNNCLLELFATWIVLFSMLLMVWTSPIPMEPSNGPCPREMVIFLSRFTRLVPSSEKIKLKKILVTFVLFDAAYYCCYLGSWGLTLLTLSK